MRDSAQQLRLECFESKDAVETKSAEVSKGNELAAYEVGERRELSNYSRVEQTYFEGLRVMRNGRRLFWRFWTRGCRAPLISGQPGRPMTGPMWQGALSGFTMIWFLRITVQNEVMK